MNFVLYIFSKMIKMNILLNDLAIFNIIFA